LNVVGPQYDVVGTQLLRAVKEVLGNAATDPIIKAWGEAYGALAKVFVDTENALKRQGKEQLGGWEGWREFVLKDKIKESSIITSFLIEPKDGQSIPLHKPGQYVGLNARFENFKTTRNYTLACKPNHKSWRLTIKKEGPAIQGAPNGLVSTYLHEKVHNPPSIEANLCVGESGRCVAIVCSLR
jgi:nitric oxide dioxygenase